MDVTGYLNILKKDLQGKDKLTADMVDSVKAFKVNLRLSIKLKVRTCSRRFTQDKLFNLEHSIFKIIRFMHVFVDILNLVK